MSRVKKAILLRVRIAFLVMLGIAVLIIVRVSTIQFVHGDEWRAKAEARNVQLRTVKASRGNIYSDNGSLLATSIPKYRLAFDPTIYYAYAKKHNQLPEYEMQLDSLAGHLASLFRDKTKKQYKKYIANARFRGKKYIRLGNRVLKYHEKKTVETWPIFREGRIPGGILYEKEEVREKPFGFLASRTIGYCKEEVVGDELRKYGPGLEYSFDSLLRGNDGQAWYEKYSGGGWKPIHDSEEIEPVNGLDIETTINVNLQDVAEEALLRKLLETRAAHGCVVVMEVNTGEVKAMANLSRVIKRDSSLRYVEKYNFAVGRSTDPGSTFKLASMMALLEENDTLSLDDSVFTQKGAMQVYDRLMRDDHYHRDYLTVKEIIEQSSNVGVAKLTMGTFGTNQNSQQRFIDYLQNFGLKQPLNFQILGAAEPKIKTPDMKSWSGISLPWMSIGYEAEVSPLQILTFYNAIANDGKMITPIVVKATRNADVVVCPFTPEVINNKICSDETLKEIRVMLEGVVERGTARNIRSNQYKIAGKTGTAQKLKDGVYVKEYYGSFVGYFPADDPKYSIIVSIDNPQKGSGYGSEMAAPVFKEIADKIYARDIDLHPQFVIQSKYENVYPVVQSGNYDDLKRILDTIGVANQSILPNSGWVTARINSAQQKLDWNEHEHHQRKIPDVRGMTLRDAIYLLENAGLKVEFEGKGRVATQSQLPGKKILVGSVIKLNLA